jgi:hypothetical protein
MLLVHCNVWAEPITFSRAIDLRRHQVACIGSTADGVSGCRPERIAKQLCVPDASDRSNFDCEPLLSGVSEEASCQADLPLQSARKSSETSCLNGDRSGGPNGVIMNRAMAYIQLVWATAQLSARKQQHELARRLVVVERMRARAGVDDDVVLFRAKLLEAQTRMRAASLEAEVLGLRQALAAQIGLSEQSLEIVPDSVPALPTIQDYSGSEQTVASHDQFELLSTQVKQLTAARDAAQLAYFLAHRDAIRMSASTTATLGEQITSQIRDGETFGLLLSEIVKLQESELALLVAVAGVERWATGTAQLTPKSLISEHRSEQAGQQVPPAETQRYGVRPEGRESVQRANAPLMKSVTPSSKRTIMVLPSDRILTVRTCKQFAAVGIADGTGKDVTSVAKWSSSKESVAIVSTSGLTTAIGKGEAVISVDLGGLSRMVRITVVDSRSE